MYFLNMIPKMKLEKNVMMKNMVLDLTRKLFKSFETPSILDLVKLKFNQQWEFLNYIQPPWIAGPSQFMKIHQKLGMPATQTPTTIHYPMGEQFTEPLDQSKQAKL